MVLSLNFETKQNKNGVNCIDSMFHFHPVVLTDFSRFILKLFTPTKFAHSFSLLYGQGLMVGFPGRMLVIWMFFAIGILSRYLPKYEHVYVGILF